ncbi:MAG: hypothetical protein RL754_1112 [Bacteroidota bacterium]
MHKIAHMRSNRSSNKGPRGSKGSGNRFADDNRSRGPRPQGDESRGSKPKSNFGGQKKFRGYKAKTAEQLVGSDEEVRLNRFLSVSGICSRRDADDLIAAGLVEVNGQVVTSMGYKVKPTDTVKYNGSMIKSEKKRYILLNKPKGFLTTMDDPRARKTVMDLVGNATKERIFPVGRLDRATTGVLLFTNDGDLAKRLTHPSHGADKIYHAVLDKPLLKADFDKLAAGITLQDGPVPVDEISYVDENPREIGLRIHIGRNRIVRRMFEHLGYTVEKLDRVSFAGLTKKSLSRGQYRSLTDQEVRFLKTR